MHVKRLYVEDVRIVDPDSPDVEMTNPQWEQIETAIRELDGKYRTTVIIGQEDPETDFMGIGGGKEGVYRCFVYDKEGREFALVDSSQTSDKCVDIPMGQTTSVSIKECMKLDTVLVAAKMYAETGHMDEQLSWKEC